VKNSFENLAQNPTHPPKSNHNPVDLDLSTLETTEKR
jgi:hypothetical protein